MERKDLEKKFLEKEAALKAWTRSLVDLKGGMICPEKEKSLMMKTIEEPFFLFVAATTSNGQASDKTHNSNLSTYLLSTFNVERTALMYCMKDVL